MSHLLLHSELPIQSLSILFNGKRKYVSFHKILRLEADRNYTWIYLSNGDKLLSSRNLSRLQKSLPDNFVRVNRSHLVNRFYLLGLAEKRYEISLVDNSSIPIAKRRVKHIKKSLFPKI